MKSAAKIFTRFWNDAWVAEQNVHSKLLFLYLLTNKMVNSCGIYELSVKQMAFETGISEEVVRELLRHFEESRKIKYSPDTNEVCIINYLKHNTGRSGNAEDKIRMELKRVKNKALIDLLFSIDEKTPLLFKEEKKDSPEIASLKILDKQETLLELKLKFPDVDIKLELEKMKDWLKANGRTQKDYLAFARNWLRKVEVKNEKKVFDGKF